MDVVTTLVSSGIGLVSGLVTAYAAMRFKLREERAKREADAREAARARYLQEANRHSTRELPQPDFGIQASPAAWIEARQVARYVLIIRAPGAAEHEKFFLMPDTRVLVGRQANADLAINDPLLSLQHCFFEAKDRELFVVDIRTGNGTTVNGIAIDKPTRLQSNDVVMVGDTRIKVADINTI
jgi:hypothetical protein